MTLWLYKARLRQFIETDVEDNDLPGIRRDMKKLGDEIKKLACFRGFSTDKFYDIPAGDEVVSAMDYANKLIERMYDYADTQRIWIE
jgi:hypothetical protein